MTDRLQTFYGLMGRYLTVITFLWWNQWEVALHWFWRGDEDPDCHDHPFDFWSYVLWGGYTEYGERGYVSAIRRAFSGWVYRPYTWRHRVELRRRFCLTLVVKRKRRKTWYFYKNGQAIYWKAYILQKGMEPV